MRSDEELRRALAHPDLPWPDETGAYDRFLRRRARHGQVMAAAAGLALVAVLGTAVLVARQLPQDRTPATPPRQPCRAHPQAGPVGVHEGTAGGVRGPQALHHRAMGPGRRQEVRPPNQ